MQAKTPYDGKIGVWYVYGGMVGETTIDEIAGTLKQYAPAVNAVYVKVSDGTEWMGTYEPTSVPKPDLAINGTNDINRWVTRLARQNLEFHAWALPKGLNPNAEADLMIQVCKQPGVRSLILDVEGGTGFFRGGREAIRPMMTKVRAALPATFHIGLSVDPRANHYSEIYPDEWLPFVNSVHPQAYWGAFQLTPDQTLKETYATWGRYGKPVIPVLQAYEVDRANMDRARNLAIRTYNAPGISWYVLGGIGPVQFPAVNVTVAGSTPAPATPPPAPAPVIGRYGSEIIVTPNSSGFRVDIAGSPLQTVPTLNGRGKIASTNASSETIRASWTPYLTSGGFWEVSVFVPAQFATTNNARYQIRGVVGQAGTLIAPIAQSPIDDLWVPLGNFQFAVGDPEVGTVQLSNATGENGLSIAFDAIRWRQIVGWTNPPRYLSDGFDAPLGSSADRRLPRMYPPIWYISNPFENYYYLGPGNSNPALHTGDDLILYDPATNTRQDAAHQPIFATASGVVIAADRATGTWGNVIVIQHDQLLATGKTVFTRYGHVENMQVKAGDRVARGQHIANVGNAFGRFAYHLHFDVSPTTMLLTRPWDWPGTNRARLEADYISPIRFIASNRPTKP